MIAMWGPESQSLDERYEWRYRPQGTVRHAFYRLGLKLFCFCGVSEEDGDGFGWRGTGNQREYDKCAGLKRCKNCLSAMGHGE